MAKMTEYLNLLQEYPRILREVKEDYRGFLRQHNRTAVPWEAFNRTLRLLSILTEAITFFSLSGILSIKLQEFEGVAVHKLGLNGGWPVSPADPSRYHESEFGDLLDRSTYSKQQMADVYRSTAAWALVVNQASHYLTKLLISLRASAATVEAEVDAMYRPYIYTTRTVLASDFMLLHYPEAVHKGLSILLPAATRYQKETIPLYRSVSISDGGVVVIARKLKKKFKITDELYSKRSKDVVQYLLSLALDDSYLRVELGLLIYDVLHGKLEERIKQGLKTAAK